MVHTLLVLSLLCRLATTASKSADPALPHGARRKDPKFLVLQPCPHRCMLRAFCKSSTDTFWDKGTSSVEMQQQQQQPQPLCLFPSHPHTRSYSVTLVGANPRDETLLGNLHVPEVLEEAALCAFQEQRHRLIHAPHILHRQDDAPAHREQESGHGTDAKKPDWTL